MDDPGNPNLNQNPVDATEPSLRPTTLQDYVGQVEIKRNLDVFIGAAKKRNQTLDHVLLSGPPGLGKTTLSYIMAHEMGVGIRSTAGPVLERQGDLAAILTGLNAGEFLFIDEIHRLPRAVEEVLYGAMEDFKLDIIVGQGPMARTVKLDLVPFTLVGATTRVGLLSSPLRERFGIHSRLIYYEAEELEQIIQRTARLLGVTIEHAAALEISRRSRGTPRVANRLLRRVRDFAQRIGTDAIALELVEEGLAKLGVDREGLDLLHLEILQVIVEKFGGGPVGLSTITAALSEPKDTIEEVYEPYLIKEGFLKKTSRGRVATPKAFDHLGHTPPPEVQLNLSVD